MTFGPFCTPDSFFSNLKQTPLKCYTVFFNVICKFITEIGHKSWFIWNLLCRNSRNPKHESLFQQAESMSSTTFISCYCHRTVRIFLITRGQIYGYMSFLFNPRQRRCVKKNLEPSVRSYVCGISLMLTFHVLYSNKNPNLNILFNEAFSWAEKFWFIQSAYYFRECRSLNVFYSYFLVY